MSDTRPPAGPPPLESIGLTLHHDGRSVCGAVPAQRVEVVGIRESIGVDVDERDSARVFVHRDKSRARDEGGFDAQPCGDGPNQGGLARAEFTDEQDNVAGMEDASQDSAESVRVSRGLRFEREDHG